MIAVTKSGDTKAKAAFGKNNVCVSSVKTMIGQLTLDPKMTQGNIEAYVIFGMDIRNNDEKNQLLQAAATKHPQHKVVIVARKVGVFMEGNGIDKVLVNPKPDDISKAVTSLLNSDITSRNADIQSVLAQNESEPVPALDPDAIEFPDEPTPQRGASTYATNKYDDEDETHGASTYNYTGGHANTNPTGRRGRTSMEPEAGAYYVGRQSEEYYMDKEDEDDEPLNPNSGAPTTLDVQELDENEIRMSTPYEPVYEDEKQKESILIERIKGCNTVADLRVVTAQMSAQEVIKNIVKDNKQYAAVEERIRGMQEKIAAILIEDQTLSLEEKYKKINALVIDKNYYRDENNTVIEQQVDQIVKLITEKTVDIINVRLGELDRAILNTKVNNVEQNYGRLAGIADERGNLLLELATLQSELDTVYANMDKMVADVVNEIAFESSQLESSPIIDAQLRAHNASIVSGKTYDIMASLAESCDKSSDSFKEAMRKLKSMFFKLQQIIDKDNETITALNQIIKLMQANKIEETVVAETFLKKSLRVYVGRPGEGKSVIPYIVSKKRSRTNANVLLVDLTGSSQIPLYTDDYKTLEDYMENRYEKEFCCVIGNPENDAETAQRLLVALTKAADYYRVINVILTPEQKVLFDVIAAEVLSVNYIVNPTKPTLDFYREFIKETRRENVAQRVIINRCDIPIKPILEELDLMERIDYQYAHLPYVPQITQCSFTKTEPDQVTVITEALREVISVC